MSDRVTIINNRDGTVDISVNYESVTNISMDNIDSNFHALQWYGDHGEIEFMDHNEKIYDISDYQRFINAHDKAMDDAVNEELAREGTPSEDARAIRAQALERCDWVVARSFELNEPVPQEWSEYRQKLRDIPQQKDFPKYIDWPVAPDADASWTSTDNS